VAEKILSGRGIAIRSRVLAVHGAVLPEDMEREIADAARSGDSVGGVIEVTATGCPAGLGDPVFAKLDALIAMAMMSIGAVKGVEIGDGFAAARMRGSEHNDQMDGSGFLSNHAGGILGGISTGAEIVVRIAVKPTPSIFREQRTIDTAGRERTISVTGRHDACIVPRIGPVAEAMLALVLADAYLGREMYRSWVPGSMETL
jgi:chorismate synthase